MPIPGYIILGCWLILIVYWFVSAFAAKQTAERNSLSSSLPYRILFVAGLVITIHSRFPGPLNLSLTPHNDFTDWLAAAVCVLGLLIALWSRWTLAGNWSSNVQFKEGHQLMRTGPYRFVRHPIYTGILLMCAAPPIQFGRLHHWLGFVLIAAGLWLKLRQEEALMLRHFPDYAAYRKETKALVPFVI
jgi:protein-S-isoprenylcysteine O-methyltransferase Ste14